jgi:1-acyl-sn-glycerol-3-phosphate acyltransferase
MAALRLLLIMFVLRPLARLLTGVDVVGRERLPTTGPAIVAGNHNSHMDTLLLLALFSARALPRVRPAAAADYFLADPRLAWFARNIIGIVPVERARAGEGVDRLAPAKAALSAGDILVIFPEGTRGADGHAGMAPLKTGVARLAEACPGAPVIPVWIQGAGRVLPKGAALPVPMNCCVLVGEPIAWAGDRDAFMAKLKAALDALEAQAPPLRWKETE